ncbi:carbohydrate-binding module family 13 protein [Amanita rubescens]|nr:carbohydrate-binding module family 13 protein [Amanita rubescens]
MPDKQTFSPEKLSMALVESGAIYRLINVKSGTVLDLSGTDRIHLSGWPDNGGTNQQWFIDFQDGYYTLQNVRYSKYVGYTEPLRLGSEGIGSISRIKWIMVPSEDDPNVFGLFVPGTKLVLELVDDGSPQPGTPVMIGLRMLSLNQAWRVDKVVRWPWETSSTAE